MSNKLLIAALLLTPLAIYTGAKDNFLIKETLTILLMLGAAAAYLLDKIEKGGKFSPGKFHPDALIISVAVFLAVELISAINAKFTMLTFTVFVIHFCFAAALVISSGLNDKQKSALFSAAVITAYVVTAYGLLQAAGIDFFDWLSGYGGRIHSSLGNPNFFGGWLAVIIPVAVERAINTKKIQWILLSALLVINLYLTGTRGAWIAFAFSAVYLFFGLKLYRSKGIVVTAAAIAVIAAIAGGGKMQEYFARKFSPQEQSVKERVFKWRTAFEMVKKNPVLGVGAGNMKVNFALYQSAVRSSAGFRVGGTSESNVHNEYFQIWAETGTLGLLAFLGIFAVYFIFVAGRQGNVGYAAAVMGFLVFSLSNFPLRITPTALYLFTFMGLSLRHGQRVQPTTGIIKRKNWTARMVIFAIYALVCHKFAILPFIADIYRHKGDLSVEMRNFGEAVNYYEKSIKMDYAHSERAAYDLGEVYRNAGRIDDALKSYGISVDIRNYGEVYNNIANCYWLKREPEKALANWETAESLGLPTDADHETVKKNIEFAKKLLKH